MDQLKLGDFCLTWLYGGTTQLDGGAMFGVVPKPLWSKRYPVNEQNQIPLCADPILVQAHGKRILIEAGMGNNRLTDKQKRNFGLVKESSVVNGLNECGLTPLDIDIVLMTHMHYDHCSGLVSTDGETFFSTFPNAKIYVQATEWNEMRNPNIRSRNTYWEENWRPIESQVVTYLEQVEVLQGVEMFHTGGHSDGHAIVRLESQGQVVLHLADILATHAHQNSLWVMAYDDYPMTAIFAKEKWIPAGVKASAWFTFYHDIELRALKWDADGKIIEKLERTERA